MTWNGKQVQSWYCCRCGDGPMLSINNDSCSMCRTLCQDHDRCGSCWSESVQINLTVDESKLERELRGKERGLNTFSADAALPLTTPEGPQQLPQPPLTEPLGPAEPHRPPLFWSEPHSSSLSWSAEPHPHELPSRLLQPAECSENARSGLLPLVSPSLLSGFPLDTHTLTDVPLVDRFDPLSLTGSDTHPVTTTHWSPKSLQPPRRVNSFRFAAAEIPQRTEAGKQQFNHLSFTPTPNRKRSRAQGDDQNDEEDRPFACPFWKRNPLHAWSSSRSCCSNHKRIRDVKQHIYRNHSNQHLTDKAKRRNQGPSGGLTELQYLQLKGYSDRTTTKREQWFAIWDIVFPNLPRPASPYVNHDLSGELDEYQKYTVTRDSDSLPTLSPDISTPVQTPQDILMSADMSHMDSVDCDLYLVSWQLAYGQERTLHGDVESLASYPSRIAAYWEQDNAPLHYHLGPDPDTLPYPCT